MTVQWQRRTGIAGLLSALLSIVAGLVLAPQPPMASDPVSSIVSYYATNRTGILLQGYVFGISWFAFLIFLAGLWRMLRASALWAAVALGGGVLFLAVNIASQATISMLAGRLARDFSTPSTMVGFHDQVVMLFTYSFFALAALLVGASTAGLEAGVLGRWVHWFGYAVAALALVTGLSIIWPSNSALFALLLVDYFLFVVWVMWTSIAILRAPPQDEDVAATRDTVLSERR